FHYSYIKLPVRGSCDRLFHKASGVLNRPIRFRDTSQLKGGNKLFTPYASDAAQDPLHADMGRRPKFAPRRTRRAALLATAALFGVVSLATSGAAPAAMQERHGGRSSCSRPFPS